MLVAVNPTRHLGAVADAERRRAAGELREAEFQYLIDHGVFAADKQIPDGEANALPVCRQGTTTAGCVSIDALVPDYLPCIPHDGAEANPTLSGYRIHQDVGRVEVTPVHIGSGAVRGGCGTVADTPIPTEGLALWLKADTLALVDGDAVITWSGVSGNGNDATQGTVANRPTYLADVLNDLPVVRFDGSDYFRGTFTSALSSDSMTVAMVVRPEASNVRGTLFGLTDSAADGTPYENFAIEHWTDAGYVAIFKNNGTDLPPRMKPTRMLGSCR